jgi:hypothetical protein
MVIYQWSASPREGHWHDARALVHHFAQFAHTSLDWSRGQVLVGGNCGARPLIAIEFAFDNAEGFQSGWERLMRHKDTADLWRALAPLLDADSIKRAVYDEQYSRAQTRER